MGDRTAVVLVVPIAPADTGNGLAMRAGMLLDALAPVADVHVVVVPVSGPADDCRWAAARARSLTVVEPVAGARARDHTTRQLADPELRAHLERTAPVPARALLAPPTLAPTVAGALPDDLGPPTAVLAMRLYLAPLGIHLAHHLAARRVVVDADDDDAGLLRALGGHDEAEAFARLAAAWLPEANGVFTASPVDAVSLATSTGLDRVDVVPNSVVVPAATPPAPGADRLLFLGNLSYLPNQLAARALAVDVLPRVRARRPGATLDLVGASGAGGLDDVGALTGVRVVGAVPEVAPWYARADVVVVPLRVGAGTRIKVLEAFAHRRAVVVTTAAVAGLDVEHGREALIADSPDDLARAVSALLADPARAAGLVAHAADLVEARYRREVVAPLVRAAVLGANHCGTPGSAVA